MAARPDFWTEYLTMLVSNRVNRFSLTFGMQYNYPMEVSDVYLYFAYPFLPDVPSYDVRARGLPDEERDRNLASLKFIAAEMRATRPRFPARPLDPRLQIRQPARELPRRGHHAAEPRRLLRRRDGAMLLTEVPQIGGVTLRIHGESGIAGGRLRFLAHGVPRHRARRAADRNRHARKGIDQKTIDVALESGMPVEAVAEISRRAYRPAVS